MENLVFILYHIYIYILNICICIGTYLDLIFIKYQRNLYMFIFFVQQI